jgi:diguanylate cyclase (GGDEF)-like protein
VYERFAAEARKLIPFDRISVNLINPDGKSFTNAYVSGLDVPDRRPGSIVPIAGSVSEVFMQSQSGRIIHVESPEDLARKFPGVTVSMVVQAGIRSLLGVPLISRDEVIGVLHFRSINPNIYTQQDLRLAEKIAAQIAGAIANAQLFTDRKRMEEEIREMSLRDQMTDLYNRRGFITLAEQQIRAANRAKRPMLLTFIDLDGLKGINDTLGHEEGDRALIDAANVLRQTFRESDVIARLGGDEFAVLSIDATDMNPEDLSKRLQENINAGNAKETRPYRLAMSWGTVVYDPGYPLSLDELMSSADERMYAQKKVKSNRRI